METLSLDDEALARLVEEGESARLEFKETLQGNAPERIRQAVCAFANDLPGAGLVGAVVVGLRDDGTPSGLRVTDMLLRQLADIRSDGNILPPPALLAERRCYRGADIAVVTVLPSDSPPVRYGGTIWVRNGPRRGVATAQEERLLNERRRSADRPFDVSPIPGTGLADLDQRRFEAEYLPNSVSREALEANDRSFPERLAAAKMIASVDDARATLLGLLVVGKRPRDIVPGAYVQFLRVAGRDLSDDIVDEAAIDGTISDMLRGLDEKLEAHNRRRVDFTGRDRERRMESFPPDALRQLTRNAVMHRTYEGTNAPVRVSWFDDRIEILSPGGPFGAVTEGNFGRPGTTDYRNPNLAEAMKVLGYVQRFGVGIPTARRLLREAGHLEPAFVAEPTHISATIAALPDLREAPR